ncbi:hypothetical protein GBF38_012675 [Nibea albiflora]|uniref:Uncharacterized protein n=1 Tax=Nibea albiflora TaxID=240163 RepID=A0ACB7EJF6_NIBAL|nr:hypothetical protein GBF38_012675 [Nibea albiflora]
MKGVTPRESLKNAFIPMDNLVNVMDTDSYADKALQFMTFSPLIHLESKPESDDSLSDTDMDSSEKTDSSYEKSDPSPSPADIECLYDDNSDAEDCSSEDEDGPSDTESCICKDSLTNSGYDADTENNSEKSSDIKSSIDGCSNDDDHIRPTRMTCFADPCFTDEDDIKPVFSYSSGGDSLPIFSDRDNTRPTEPSLHFDEASSENRPSTPGFCGEDLPSESSNYGHSGRVYPTIGYQFAPRGGIR